MGKYSNGVAADGFHRPFLVLSKWKQAISRNENIRETIRLWACVWTTRQARRETGDEAPTHIHSAPRCAYMGVTLIVLRWNFLVASPCLLFCSGALFWLLYVAVLCSIDAGATSWCYPAVFRPWPIHCSAASLRLSNSAASFLHRTTGARECIPSVSMSWRISAAAASWCMCDLAA